MKTNTLTAMEIMPEDGHFLNDKVSSVTESN